MDQFPTVGRRYLNYADPYYGYTDPYLDSANPYYRSGLANHLYDNQLYRHRQYAPEYRPAVARQGPIYQRENYKYPSVYDPLAYKNPDRYYKRRVIQHHDPYHRHYDYYGQL